MCQGFSHLIGFLPHFVLAKIASIRVIGCTQEVVKKKVSPFLGAADLNMIRICKVNECKYYCETAWWS